MDRSLGAFRSLIERFVGNALIGPRVDYLGAYPCVAVTQNGDGTLELQPDDARLPPLSSVPIRYGVPGVSATVANGGRVMVEFAGADPAKPFASVWESASITALTLGGPGGMQGIGLGVNLRAELDALWTAMYAHTHVVATTGTATAQSGTAAPAIGTPSKQTVTSSIVKVVP